MRRTPRRPYILVRVQGVALREFMNIPMWNFLAKKEGDVEKNQTNSVLWGHSKEVHDNQLKTSDWTITCESPCLDFGSKKNEARLK